MGADEDRGEVQIPGISEAEEIGSGGFGVVYRAREDDLGRTVAVKILTGNLDDAARLRFDRERRAMGTLSGHPNIVTIYRGGYTPRGNAYLVMEYLARGSLATRLRASGPIPWADALVIGVQLAGALETSHRAGVLHRDIKPGNILASNLGHAKLCDFGIARLQGAPETRSSVVTASLAHAPPEIMAGQRPGAGADVYSLASTLYELVTGRAPFVRPTDESMMPILSRIATEPVPPVEGGLLPGPFFAAIEAAMAKDPADRPATAAVFGQRLVEAQRQLGQSPTPIPIESIALESVADAAGGTVMAPVDPPWATPNPPSGPTAPPARPVAPAARTVTTGPPPAPAGSAPASTGSIPDPTGPRPGSPVSSAGSGLADLLLTGFAPPVTGTSAEAPADAPSTTAALGSAPGPARPVTRPPWLVPVAAGAAALSLAALLALVAWRTGGGDDVGTTNSASTTGADASLPVVTPTTGVEAGTGASGPADTYGSSRFVSDSTGSIRLQVPDEWTADTERGPGQNDLPYLATAPKLDSAFFDAFTGPGVSVELIEGTVDPVAVLEERRNPDTTARCDAPATRDFVDPYQGQLEAFNNCGGTGTLLVHAVMVDPELGFSIFVTLQGPTAKDVTEFEAIIDSIELSANY